MLITISLYFCLPLWAILKFKLLAVFNFFAADTFYYLAIAKRSSEFWNSVDGSTHTNGFHPLWQNILNLIHLAFDPSEAMFIYLVFALSLLLTYLGFVLMSQSCRQVTNSQISWIFMFPGLVYVCGSQATTAEYGASNIYQPLSFINGMESPLTIVFFGVLIFYLRVRRSLQTREWFFTGCIIALITMSRLDDVFLVLGFVAFLLLFVRESLVKKLLALTAPVLGAVLSLFTYHFITGQTLMPVSGLIKGSDTGEFPTNIETLKRVIQPVNTLEPVATRVYGLFIPVLLATSYLIIYALSRLSSARQETDSANKLRDIGIFLVPLSVYVIFKFIYTWNNFYLIETGYWYYVGPVICVNFIAALLVGILFDRGLVSKVFLVTIIGLIQIFNLTYTSQKLQTNNVMHSVFMNRDQLRSDFQKLFETKVKVIDGTDGIYSFIFENSSQSARGFTINRDGYEAFKDGGYKSYYEYLLKNQYTTLIGLNVYTHPVPNFITVVPLFEDPKTGTVFSKLVPKQSG
jgi:hypothetical protein